MTLATAPAGAQAREAPPATTVSGKLAQFITGLAFRDLPEQVVEKAKLRLLDCLGTALAAGDLKVPGIAMAFVRGNSGEATLYGKRERVPAIDAAFVNAALINGRSEDDFLQKSHAGAVTIPTALAIAEVEGKSGADVLLSLVIGYELVGRSYMGGPAMLPQFRASGVAGTIGAAATAAKLFGLDTAATMSALGCAAVFSHGFGQGFVSGTTEVKLNVAMASRNGLSAAILARLGATASPLAFEGDVGFFRAFSGSLEHVEAATRDLGKRFLIEDTVYKECPVCIFTQTPIALARSIAAQVAPERIEKVTITAPELTYTNPGFTNVAPFGTHLQAVVSARFCTAAALLGKPVENHAFYDQLEEPEVLALAQRIELVLRPADHERVDVEVLQRDGTIRASGIEMDTLLPTREKILAKFRRLAGSMPFIRSEEIIEVVMGLEGVTEIRALTDLLQRRD